MNRYILFCLLLLLLGAPLLAADVERVIVRCDTGCERLAAGIEALGGEITHRYRYIDALAATVPSDRRGEILAHPDAGKVYEDAEIAPPETESVAVATASGVAAKAIRGPQLAALLGEQPGDVLYNTALTGARELHLRGHTGDGVVIAVIDTGIVNRPDHVLAGKVLGGESFVPGDEQSATSRLNHPHGTWISCTIAAEGIALIPTAGALSQSLQIHAPDSIFPCDGVSCPPGISRVPVLGTAPGAGLYALKTYGATSEILAAMERALTLKRNYDAGVPAVPVAGDGSEDNPYVYDALNVRVVSLGHGFRTSYAGHDPEEEMTRAMFEAGILPVFAAGNGGPAAMTLSDLGTGHGTVTVGAAAILPHARIYLEQGFFPGAGYLIVPSDHHQVNFGSARGPLPDGRLGLDVVVNGFGVLAQGPDGEFALGEGTSLAGPTVAGAAALLFGAVPGASAAEVRAALVASANPSLLGDGSAPIDRGYGYIDIPAALEMLEAGGLDTTLPRGVEGATVSGNIAALGFKAVRLGTDGSYSTRVEDLRPGQVAHLFVESSEKTDLIRVSLRNVTPELPPGRQNVLFGDGLSLYVVDAPTSEPDVLVDEFLAAEGTVELAHPQTGVLRIAVVGRGSNAGRVSADVVIEAEESPPAPELAAGKIEDGGEWVFVDVPVPPGTGQAVFELSWANHWGAYPTDGLDLFLVDPAGNLIWDGVTQRCPERVVVDDPMPGVWQAVIVEFTVHGVHGSAASHWALRVTDQNGASL